MPTLLVVADERSACRAASLPLGDRFDLVLAASGIEAVAVVRERTPDVVLADLDLWPTLATEVRALDPFVPIVVYGRRGSLEKCVRAVGSGATDFVIEPLDQRQPALAIERALGVVRLAAEVDRFRELTRPPRTSPGVGSILGASPAVARLRERIAELARGSEPVLVVGPRGSELETVARAIHEEGQHRLGPFIVASCSTLPRGAHGLALLGAEGPTRVPARSFFELARGGTLFLDEVGALAHEDQQSLVNVIERSRREVRAPRVIATSRAGALTPRLAERFAGAELKVPALSERPEDVPVLFARFLERACTRLERPIPELTDGVLKCLRDHEWPGDARELELAAERVAHLAPETIGLEHLPPALVVGKLKLTRAKLACERELVEAALARHGGHRGRAAKALGVSLRTLHYKLARRRPGEG